MVKIINKILFAAVFSCAIMSVNGCSEDITVGQTDESAYSELNQLNVFLRDQQSGLAENTIDLGAEAYETTLYVGLNKTPYKGVDLKVEYDAEYLQSYNTAHESNLKLFPKELLTLGNNGSIIVAPDEKTSFAISLNVQASAELEVGTYLLPLTITTSTDGINVSDNRCVYLVNKMDVQTCDKGEDAVKNFLFIEVNDVNPLNALEIVREDGKLFFDAVVIFAANINYNGNTGKVYVHQNSNVKFLLDHSDEYIQPLRRCGIKVLLGILGNHDAAGVCQLSDLGARLFAEELKNLCNTYNLDGVNFDDEYSKNPDTSNPLFTGRSQAAGSRLLFETKKAMPDKMVTVYYLGQMLSTCPPVDGIEPGRFVDVAVEDYGKATAPMAGMSLKQCAGYSAKLDAYPAEVGSVEGSRQLAEKGYGWHMLYNLNPKYYFSNFNQFTYMQNSCKGFYDMDLKRPTHYYKKTGEGSFDATRYPFEAQ